MATATGRPSLAVWKFASCDGCQLSLLDCEDELLAIAEQVQIAYFPEATRTVIDGPYDLSLVEGSVTTPHDAERIRAIRSVSKRLITIGACATAGGIQALRQFADVTEFTRYVYAQPEWIETLASSDAIAAHVAVDYELRGCPVAKEQLLEVLGAFLCGRRPQIPDTAVCQECKRSQAVCLLVAAGTPCLGPVTHAGCQALCPRFGRGCYGCFGPKENAQPAALSAALAAQGISRKTTQRLYTTFNVAAEAFRNESERLESESESESAAEAAAAAAAAAAEQERDR
ncbi:oxidoreductase [Halorhodospira abdelmalekii]|uniref:NADH-quinone oxidoreductase subunit B family protein n=1 Tax=Halorhodospira abdelmalekii TaxID=421629 RepID=UPI0019080800|nr:oxidoreductase [Halorhodospira abdelmalekii]MBK1735995.1 oxidoreductase [Halorhodospira abdelmalekii]